MALFAIRGELSRKAEACRSWFYPFARALDVAQGPIGEGDPRDQQPHLFSKLHYIKNRGSVRDLETSCNIELRAKHISTKCLMFGIDAHLKIH